MEFKIIKESDGDIKIEIGNDPNLTFNFYPAKTKNGTSSVAYFTPDKDDSGLVAFYTKALLASQGDFDFIYKITEIFVETYLEVEDRIHN